MPAIFELLVQNPVSG